MSQWYVDCMWYWLDFSSSLTNSYLSQQKRKEHEAAVMKNSKLTVERKKKSGPLWWRIRWCHLKRVEWMGRAKTSLLCTLYQGGPSTALKWSQKLIATFTIVKVLRAGAKWSAESKAFFQPGHFHLVSLHYQRGWLRRPHINLDHVEHGYEPNHRLVQ